MCVCVCVCGGGGCCGEVSTLIVAFQTRIH